MDCFFAINKDGSVYVSYKHESYQFAPLMHSIVIVIVKSRNNLWWIFYFNKLHLPFPVCLAPTVGLHLMRLSTM